MMSFRCLSLLVIFLLPNAAACHRGGPGVTELRPTSEVTAEAIVTADADWPGWWGPDGNGQAREAAGVTQWSPDTNVLWQADVPGQGHSSPIVMGDQVAVTTQDSERLLVLAFDRATGASRWQTEVHTGALPRKHPKNSHASATLAWDGRSLFAVFIHGDGLFITALDAEGQQKWQTRVGPFRSEHGYGSSPVLHGSLVIVNGDNLGDCYVAAVHRETGELVWLTRRRGAGSHGSYATPIVAQIGGQDHLLLSGIGQTSCYDPATGEERWSLRGPAEVTACTIAVGDQMLFTSGGYPEKELLAVRFDGKQPGEVVWRTTKGVTYVPSPLYHQGRLYVVNDQGIACCYDAETGEEKWRERLSGAFSASPIVAGEFLFVTNESGTTYVLRTGDQYELVAQNRLSEGGFATPAICGGKIYLRTGKHLYCVGASGKSEG